MEGEMLPLEAWAPTRVMLLREGEMEKKKDKEQKKQTEKKAK